MMNHQIPSGPMEYEEVENIMYESLGFCGCMPIEPLEKIHACLTWANRETQPQGWTPFEELVQNTFTGDEGSAYCVLMLLEKAELLEHGIAIRAAWLTKKGERLLLSLTPATLEHLVK